MARRRGLTQKDIEAMLEHPIRTATMFGVCVLAVGIWFCVLGHEIGKIGIALLILGGFLLLPIMFLAIGKIAKAIATRPRKTNVKQTDAAPIKKYPVIDIDNIIKLEGCELDRATIGKILKIELNRVENSKSIDGKNCTISGVRVENGRVKFNIEQCQTYRTVERYVQRDYVRTPVYSETKLKFSNTEKSFKLTNAELEALDGHHDVFLARFSYQIITLLRDPALVPSWYLRKTFTKCQREANVAIARAVNDAEIIKNSVQRITEEKLFCLEKPKLAAEKALEKLYLKRDKKGKVSDKLAAKVSVAETRLNDINAKIEVLNKQAEDNISTYEHNQAVYAEQKRKVSEICDDLIGKIKALPTDLTKQDVDFVALSELQKMERQKIIGVYIIRNRDNGKCYVGQSKDVLRRINQHFKGTEPKNIIFAEDYYSEPESKRSTLFEIKVIPLETKDEMDLTEKNLIEEYEAFTNGYNGTAGNT